MFYIQGQVISDQFHQVHVIWSLRRSFREEYGKFWEFGNLREGGPLSPKVNVKILANLNFLVKTKYVPKGLKCKINTKKKFLIRGSQKGGVGGPPLGKISQIIP